MKVSIWANERNEQGQSIGGVFKKIYEAEESVEIILGCLPPYKVWRMDVIRNGLDWLVLYLSNSQLAELRRKLRQRDSHSIICPSSNADPWPFGSPSNFVLNATCEGYLEIVKTPEWHRVIFEKENLLPGQ